MDRVEFIAIVLPVTSYFDNLTKITTKKFSVAAMPEIFFSHGDVPSALEKHKQNVM